MNRSGVGAGSSLNLLRESGGIRFPSLDFGAHIMCAEGGERGSVRNPT